MYKIYIPFLLIIVLSFFTVKPLLQNGFFTVHDNVQVERVYEMGQALKDGQFPVRMVKNLGYGYGYPIFNFYAPLPYYFGGALNAVGIDAVVATKAMFLLGILMAGIFMYLLAYEFWGLWGAFLSSVLYLYSPFHALDIYVRGAVGEFWAFAFLPLVFLGMYKIFKSNGSSGVIIGVIGLTGVILSHNLTAFMLIPFLILYFFILLLYSKQKKFLILNFCFLLLTSLLLSAFYWLPALTEMKFSNVMTQIGGGADFHQHFIFLSQIWDFPWGFGGSAGLQSGISYKIGKLNIILWVLGMIFFLKKYQENKLKPIYWLSFVGFLMSVYLTTDYSVWVWDLINQMSFIQYPWRFLIFSVFFSALISGAIVTVFNKDKISKIISLLFIFAVIFYQSKYFASQDYIADGSFYTDTNHLNWQASKISDEYLPNGFQAPEKESKIIKILNADTLTKSLFAVNRTVNKSNLKTYRTISDSPALLTLAIAHFPGWVYFVDDNQIKQSEQQLASFTIPKGNHIITAKFTNTPVRSIANLLTLLGIIFAGVILRKRKYEKSK